MFRRFLVLGVVICLLASPIAVYADVIITEQDIWYMDHADEMMRLDRNIFCVNGPDGYAVRREYPGWGEDVDTIPNGVQLSHEYSTYAYLYEGEYHVSWNFGWVPMNHLLVVYEAKDWEEENKDRFYAYTGNCDFLLTVTRLVFWQWPGADREKRVFDIGGEHTIRYAKVLHAYKDSNGLEWGFVEVGYDWRSTRGSGRSTWEEWICLNAPENSRIFPSNPAPKPMPWSLDGVYEWEFGEGFVVTPYSLLNFMKDRAYNPILTFHDIPYPAWYRNAVVMAYEYGIIDGKGNNTFDPNGNLTGAEALTIASRIHAYYKYGKAEGDKKLSACNEANIDWWDGAISYCEAENLMPGNELDDYFAIPISRAQMVHTWAKILQPKDMPKLNTVERLPDVDTDTPYARDILLFYEVGIIGGVDGQGTFDPDNNITRAEAAHIFMNLIETDNRHSGRVYGK